MNKHDLRKIAKASKKYPLYGQDGCTLEETLVTARLYCPHIGRTWYITEYDKRTTIALCWYEEYVKDSSQDEWRYTSISKVLENGLIHIDTFEPTFLTALTKRAF